MKILHVIAGLKLSSAGGVSNYVRMLAKTQYGNGNEIWVLGEKDNIQYPFNYYEYKSDNINNFTLGKMEDRIALKKVDEFLTQQNFDIIHLHSIFNLDWNLFEVLKPYTYIVSLHDYFYLCPRGAIMINPDQKLCECYSENECTRCISLYEQMIEKYWLFRKSYGFFKKILKIDLKNYLPYYYQYATKIRFEKMKKLLENANVLLPVSKKTKEIYQKSNIFNKYKIVYIGNIHADYYQENYLISPLNNDNRIHLAMIGELSYMKGAEILINISKQLDKNKYVIHFYGKCEEKYKKKAIKCGIICHGKYSQNKIGEILKNIDIGLVLPVCEDAGPQVVMELLNNHIPVIATCMGGIPDFISEDNGFLFNPYSQDEFKRLMIFIDNLSFEQINKLKKNIKRTTTTQEHYVELNEIYKNLLNSK